ncbi:MULTISPECIES: class I SAM-dependent methyltransferase [Sorangium]|uniref:class I SAM-dependent methyltransferase n=1 Tax=Sorangium TaxID=39643 RepID=UPI003D9C6061
MYRLFDELAHRYDLHTPPDHYRHDHAFVLEQAAALGSPCRLLDVGCGTGVLVEKALQAGVLATGIDASPAMIHVAQARVGTGVAAVRRMQDVDDEAAYDLVVSLSWTLNYCSGRAELVDVLRRLRRALRPGGRVLLQVAHGAHVDGRLMEDREPGPTGEPDDVLFLYRFMRLDGEDWPIRAEYVYACKSLNELTHEQHLLRMADAHAVAACVREVGLRDVQVYDSWRRDPLQGSPSPFVSAVQEAASR